MSKPEPTRFPSDDFEVVVNGVTYHPHEGEYVELFPDRSVQEILATTNLTKFGAQMRAAQGDPDEQMQVMGLLGDQYTLVCEHLAGRVVAWSWTDRLGNPLPQPDGTPGVIAKLSDPEIGYLLSLKASEQENEADRKNGSRPSPTSSSATRSRPSRASRSGGRSR